MLATMGDPGACTERLIREVMHVDAFGWPEAAGKVEEMAEALPRVEERSFALGGLAAGVSLTAAAASLPLVFSYDVALWFNAHYVTADVPEPKDLETWLEVPITPLSHRLRLTPPSAPVSVSVVVVFDDVTSTPCGLCRLARGHGIGWSRPSAPSRSSSSACRLRATRCARPAHMASASRQPAPPDSSSSSVISSLSVSAEPGPHTAWPRCARSMHES
jgi:hypothetical protein